MAYRAKRIVRKGYHHDQKCRGKVEAEISNFFKVWPEPGGECLIGNHATQNARPRRT